MAATILKIKVKDIDLVLQSYDRIKIYRSTTGETGIFNELTTVATRIVLEEDKVIYEFTDDNGDENYYYKTSYFNSSTLEESNLSAATKGQSDKSSSILSVNELKNTFLFGIDLTDDAGNPMPDTLFELYIDSAIALVEGKLDIQLACEVIEDERHDYYVQEYNKFVWFKTFKAPIQSVQSVQLVLPTEQPVINYLPEWIHFDKHAGHIEIVPGAGQIVLGQTGAFLPVVFGGQDYLPQALRISYTAGYDPDKIPADLKEAIGMLASFGPLGIAGDLILGAGIAGETLSLDGLTQTIQTTSSATNSGYGARLVQYRAQLQAMWPILRAKYSTQRLTVV